jgi:hypothetical protein
MKRHVKLKLFVLVSLLFFFGHGIGIAQEKNVSIHVENASLEEVFNVIEKQTSYRFSYRNVVVDSLRNITLSKSNATVPSILDEVLVERNLTYNIVSTKSIVISEKSKPCQTNRKAQKPSPESLPTQKANRSLEPTSY